MSVRDHLTGTDGARTVTTGQHLTCEVMVAHAARFDGIFVVTSGVAGVGKSLSTKSAALATGLEVHRVQFTPDASVGVANAILLDSLGVRTGRGDYVPETTAEIRRLLDQRRRLLLVESAHDASGDVLAHLRVLHSQASFTLGFVGHRRFLSRASTQPELFDDADRWIEFSPLAHEEMLAVLSDYHPAFATAPPEFLAAIDEEHCHGRWKRWAQFLRTALLYAGDEPECALSPRVLDFSLKALNWRSHRDPREARR